MPINKIPQRAFNNDDMLVDNYTATAGQTAFTLTRAAAVNSLLVHVNDVIQQPTVDYTVAGTTLTMTSALSANDDVRIRIMTERPLGTQSGGSGATTLGALNDVSSATPATGQVLKWSGTQWAPDADATGGGGSSLTIQDEGVALSTAATTLNFVGSGITASGTGATKTITVSGTGGSGIALTDLSVASEGTASGDGSIAYNNTNGQFTYTPPTLNGLTNAGDVDFGSNKILYSNHYAQLSDLPSASTYHGMFAHVHGTGKAYYAHAGNWVPLADESQLTLDGLTGVSTTGVTSGQVLKYNGTSWAPAADSAGSSGIALGDISVGAEGTASGDGSLAYNSSTGVFTYTPPVIPAVSLPDDQEFGVTSSGASAYVFSGGATGNNPTLNLQRGKTYRFDINASGHPFQIRVSNGGAAYTNGVVTQNNTNGAVYFTVPEDAPATLVYQCTSHAAMVGTINCVGYGIGTTSPTTYGDANTRLAVVQPTSNANDVNIQFGTSDVRGIAFVNDVSGDAVGFGSMTDDAVKLVTNGTDRVTVNTNGEVQLVNGQTLNGSGALIQTKCKIVNTMASGNPVNTWTEIHSNYRVSIMPKYSDSHIIGNWMIPINPQGASNILMAIVPWISTDGGTTKTIITDGIQSGSRHHLSQSFFRSNNGYDGNDMQNHIVKFRHTAINTTSSHTYGFYFRSEGNNTTYFCHSGGNNSTWGWTAGMKLELTEVRP